MSQNLSKAQLLSFLQCPRRFWLDQYHPEHEGDTAAMDAYLDAEEAADAAARNMLTGNNTHAMSGRLGLRSAIEQTGSALKPGVTLLNATFEHDNIAVHVDVLNWSGDKRQAISITAAAEVSRRHIEDCAIQSWVFNGLELPRHNFVVGLSSVDAVSSHDFQSRFVLTDVTDRVAAEVPRIDSVVTDARRLHASLDEPPASTGSHCQVSGYTCPFLDYCEQR